MMEGQAKNPYWFIPTLYIWQGLPFAIVTVVSVVIYKNLKFQNTEIAFYTSFFTVPWLLKPLLAPIAEKLLTRQQFIVLMQLCMAILFLIMAFCFSLPYFFYTSTIIFLALALASTLHDMNVDGFYILTLTRGAQIHFIAIRSLCYQIGRLLGQGAIIYFASILFARYGITRAWAIAFVILSVLTAMIALFHRSVLPITSTANKLACAKSKVKQTFSEIRNDFFAIPFLPLVILFVLFFNLADNQLIKIVPLFLMDHPSVGGLGLKTQYVGIIDGAFGVSGMLSGLFLSSFILNRYTLQQSLPWLMFFTTVTKFGYLALSYFAIHAIGTIGSIIFIAQFGFGLSNGAYMLYLLYAFGRGKNPMSLYALGTALMGLSVVVGGAISGYLQLLLGYNAFFLWIVINNALVLLLVLILVQKNYLPEDNREAIGL